MKLHSPLLENLIPNQPEISINTFTHTIDMDSIIVRVIALVGLIVKSVISGFPIAQKSECTTNTKNIARILNNSIFDCLGPLVIEEIDVISKF